MANYVTSLPMTDNNGNLTIDAVKKVFEALDAHKVAYTYTTAVGFWQDPADRVIYEDRVYWVRLTTSNILPVHRALAEFGKDADQQAVLLVEDTPENYQYFSKNDLALPTVRNGRLVGSNVDYIASLLDEYTGVTALDSGEVFSLRYAALEKGLDY